MKNSGSKYGSYAKLHAASHEDYIKLHALSEEDTQKLIDNGFFKEDNLITYKEAIEFLLECKNG